MQAYSTPGFLVSIGGDHSIGSFTVSAGVTVHPELAVLWVDAHADCNTPEISPSNNYHGMPLAHVLGWFREPTAFAWFLNTLQLNSVVLIGIRDVDEKERILLELKGIKCFWMDDVKEKGIETVMNEALEYLEATGKRKFHLSLDVDVMDPLFIPGTGTPVVDGLSLPDLQCVFRELKQKKDDFVSMDLAEVNFDIEQPRTLQTLTELTDSLFTNN